MREPQTEAMPEWIDLAADIRAVDGNHDLGAGALAQALTERGWSRSDEYKEATNAAMNFGDGYKHGRADALREASERVRELDLYNISQHGGRVELDAVLALLQAEPTPREVNP